MVFNMLNMLETDKEQALRNLVQDRIVMLDGAMGTMVQALSLTEKDVRGERFADHHKEMGNFSDLLCLTQPDAITNIHRAYFDAGSDIVSTNTFNASPVGAMEYELSDKVIREINIAAAECARKAADEFNEKTPDRVLSLGRLGRLPSKPRSPPKSKIRPTETLPSSKWQIPITNR